MKAILLLSALATAFLEQRAPDVLGTSFQRFSPRLTGAQHAAKLQKRQNVVSANLDNVQIAYLINITIGTPAQQFSVQLDTGSADLWVIASNAEACLENAASCQGLGAYNIQQSSSAKTIGQNAFNIAYQDNSAVRGDYVTDVVSIQGSAVRNQTFGLATSATRTLGILGVGYDAGESAASTDPTNTYPNLVQSLRNDNFIRTTSYSLWLDDYELLQQVREINAAAATGSILFGGVDAGKYLPPLTVLPIQKSTNNTYRTITVDLDSFSFTDAAAKQAYSQTSLNLPVILDCGTTDTYLPNNIVQDIVTGVGAINNPDLGLIVPCYLQNSPTHFTFTFGGADGAAITVPLSELVNPIYNDDGSRPTFRDGSGAVCAFGLQPAGTDANSPILLGDTFLRSAYVVYNLEGNTVAIANTKFNSTDTNVQAISQASSIPGASATATATAASQAYTGNPMQTQNARKPGKFSGGAQKATFNLGVSKPKGGSGPSNSASLARVALAVLGGLVLGSVLL